MNVGQRLLVLLALLVIAFSSFSAFAQEAIPPYIEYRKRVEVAQNISPLDSGLFGEQVSLYNGSTTFSVTDIDIPGNSILPVQLVRKFAVELQPQNDLGDYDSLLRGVGNWDVDVPHMAATYHAAAGNALRCNGGYVADFVVGGVFRRGEVWQGISINVPGRGSTSAMGMQTATPRPTGGATYKLATSERDVFDCIPMKAGFTGEGFRMTTTSGLRYYFDVGASRTAARLKKYIKIIGSLPLELYLDRNRLYLLASKIEDRLGNTVQFQYNANGHPTRIWANDGREINLTYTGGRLATATSHGRTWQYQYTHISSGMYARLSQVTQPDSSKWQYSYTDDLMPSPDPAVWPPLPWCAGFPTMLDVGLTLTATHPSGAVGIFNFSNSRHYRSGVHATECMQSGDPADPDYDLLVPHFFDVMNITNKTINGPGLQQPMAWSYSYAPHLQTLWGVHTVPLPYPCTTCTAEKTVTVTNPDNTKSRYTLGMRYHDNDGRQLKVETLRANDTVIHTEASTYMTEVQAASQPFHGEYGTNLGSVADPASSRVRPVTNRTISQDSVNFIWQANSFDTRARPKSVTKASTVAGSPTRTEETFYWDNDVKWVLGQVKTVTCKAPTSPLPTGCEGFGVEVFDRTYDATYALPLATKRFGKVEQTLTWDTTSPLANGARGTAKTVADGNGNITTLSSWKRGTPQSIKYPGTPEAPAGATHAAQVNDNGWIEWVDDENGFRTNYTHDAMGRLASIIYPLGDTTAWNTTTQVFQQIASTEYGIPSGHWRQTVTTGNGKKIAYYDALWRPVVVEKYDAKDAPTIVSTRSISVTRYDENGRQIFQSYPLSSLVNYADASLTGIDTLYDALGRQATVSQDSELGLLTTTTEYLAGFKTRITPPNGMVSPAGRQTTTSYMVWDQPSYDLPVAITHPEEAFTDITRDVFGKPTALKRRNSASSLAITRSYAYNANQELCRRVEPETGATLMGYDGAGNLVWSAIGLPAATACDPTGTTPAVVARKASRTYDARNRVKTLSFPDGRDNQSWAYTLDGLAASITNDNAPGGEQVISAYTYNKRRMMTGESMTQTGWYTWSIGYGYDGIGHLSTQIYQGGSSVSYAPNALGQATQVKDNTNYVFASGAQYYPNGALKQFTYGNGLTHVMTQNARQLPARVTDSGNALDHAYSYDKNGNPTQILDYIVGAPTSQHRYMQYDGLDHLTAVNSAMFGGDQWHRFTYDVLDNLKSWKLVGVKDYANYYYDANNRLTIIQNSAGANVVNLSYDPQGNLASKNGQGYAFNYGNRMREVTGKEYYRYDGQGRRIMAWSPTLGGIFSQYTADGKLFFQEDQRSGTKWLYHLYLGGNLVAIRETSTAGGLVTRYQHTDALGSPVAVSNEAGVVVERNNYEPYGSIIGKPNYGGVGFTGHAQDAATGLINMQQRYYDPGIGRFLSVDPVSADTVTGWNFNRYNYAANNPYKFKDPDGRIIDTIWDAANVVYDLGKAALGGIRGDRAMVREGLSDAALDGAAMAVPFVPAGSSKVIRAGKEAIEHMPSERAAKRAAERTAGMGKHGGRETRQVELRPGSKAPSGDPGNRTEVVSTDTGRMAHHDPNGTKHSDGSTMAPHWGAEDKSGKTIHYTYPKDHDPTKNR